MPHEARTPLHDALHRWFAARFIGRVGLLLVVGLLIAGYSPSTTNATTRGTSSAQPARTFAGLVDIGGGRKMYLECRGSGSPTVVFISGRLDRADIWKTVANPRQPGPAVLPGVAKFTRVCAYDRPGTVTFIGQHVEASRSTPVPQPTTAANGVTDLHALLIAAKVPGPYVLVAHSWGGMIARLYAANYPNKVSGLVLVDILTELLYDGLTPKQQAWWISLNSQYPPELDRYHQEKTNFLPSFQSLRTAPPLRRMPVVSLVADDRDYNLKPYAAKGLLPPGIPVTFGPVIFKASVAGHMKLAARLHAKLILNTNAGHYIHTQQPQLVINSIRYVVDRVRNVPDPPGLSFTPRPNPTLHTMPAGVGLKPIDQRALQAIVRKTARELHVPGALVRLRTPQGEFTAAYGTTRLGSRIRPQPYTHFRIASITKTMTSAVILQLAQEGKLRLSDPVSKYVAGVPNGDQITIALLLKMRSGLFDYTSAPEMAPFFDNEPTKVWTPQELLAISFARPPNFPPGRGYEYSNTNYALLGLIVEKVDGRPLATAMQKRLFGPLGLKDTVLPPSTSNRIPKPFAHGYLYGSSSAVTTGIPKPPYTPEFQAAVEAGTVQPKDYTGVNHSFATAAGGAISTADDLDTWIRALVGGRVLNHRYQRLWRASPLPTGQGGLDYGFGINRLHWGPNALYLHGGETVGYNSEAAYDPTNKLTLVVWTNLTISPFDGLTANRLMLNVLDRVYKLSPLAPGALAPQPG